MFWNKCSIFRDHRMPGLTPVICYQIDRFALGFEPLRSRCIQTLWSYVPHNLSAQESPVPLPKFHMTPRPKILIYSGVQERNPDKLPSFFFFFKNFWQANPLLVPQWGPQGEKYPFAGHFYVSHNISLIVFLSESPVREHPPCSLTGSPQTGVLRHQSHWPSEGILFIHSFVKLFARGPQKEPSYIHKGKT